MASEELNLTAQIVMAHASMTELTPKELVDEIKCIYALVSTIDDETAAGKPGRKDIEADAVKKPSIPLKDIIRAKYVVCLECGKKLKTLKFHLRKAHGLKPKEYFQRFGLDPKKYPLVCKEYSKTRSRLAKEREFGELGRKLFQKLRLRKKLIEKEV
jgi:predicted transcriptional regulator